MRRTAFTLSIFTISEKSFNTRMRPVRIARPMMHHALNENISKNLQVMVEQGECFPGFLNAFHPSPRRVEGLGSIFKSPMQGFVPVLSTLKRGRSYKKSIVPPDRGQKIPPERGQQNKYLLVGVVIGKAGMKGKRERNVFPSFFSFYIRIQHEMS